MTEPKSACCGAEVEMDEDTVPDSGFRLMQETYYYCSKCHKPCSITKLPKTSKEKEEK